MLSTERSEFEKQIKTMMGGFPGYFLTEERMEAYWRGLQKMNLSYLIRVVDFVLSEDGPEKIPSVSVLWGIYRNIRATRADNRVQIDAPLSREAHLAHMRRVGIVIAKNETMPKQNGVISRDSTAHTKKKVDQEWAKWDATYGTYPDEYWAPRAEELMRMWGEKNPNEGGLDLLKAMS